MFSRTKLDVPQIMANMCETPKQYWLKFDIRHTGPWHVLSFWNCLLLCTRANLADSCLCGEPVYQVLYSGYVTVGYWHHQKVEGTTPHPAPDFYPLSDYFLTYTCVCMCENKEGCCRCGCVEQVLEKALPYGVLTHYQWSTAHMLLL